MRNMVVMAVLLAGANSYAALYRMEGGVCTNSVREWRVDEENVGTLGPKLCVDQVTVEMRLADGYTPGDFFFVSTIGDKEKPYPLESFYYSDGAYSFTEDFDAYGPGGAGGYISGRLGVGRGFLTNGWSLDGYLFESHPDGTWSIGVDQWGGYGGFRREELCPMDSVVVRHDVEDWAWYECAGIDGAVARGTFDAWRLVDGTSPPASVPEPAGLALLALTIALSTRRPGRSRPLSISV
jgi:hypothetical protein